MSSYTGFDSVKLKSTLSRSEIHSEHVRSWHNCLRVCAPLACPHMQAHLGCKQCTYALATHALDVCSSKELLAQVGMLLLAGSCGGAMLLPMLATLPCHIAWYTSRTQYLSA